MRTHVRCVGAPDDRDPYKLTVIVEKEDIKEGKRGKAAFCPIARATRRADTQIAFVSVGRSDMYIHRKEGWHRQSIHTVKLPDHVREWVRAFDRGYRVSPFQFTVRY